MTTPRVCERLRGWALPLIVWGVGFLPPSASFADSADTTLAQPTRRTRPVSTAPT